MRLRDQNGDSLEILPSSFPATVSQSYSSNDFGTRLNHGFRSHLLWDNFEVPLHRLTPILGRLGAGEHTVHFLIPRPRSPRDQHMRPLEMLHPVRSHDPFPANFALGCFDF